jgi:AcrR family transcriptional regulator
MAGGPDVCMCRVVVTRLAPLVGRGSRSVSLTTYRPVGILPEMPAKLDHRQAEVKAKSAQLGSSREQLLAAASRVFARSGYHGASMSEIAAEAGFSKGALYWSFASKDELFFALLDKLDEQLRALITAAASAPADRDISGDLSRDISAVLEHGHDVVLLFHEYSALAVRDPKVAARYAERNVRLREELAASMRARHEAIGVPMAIPAEQLATAVIALVDGLSIQQLTEPNVVPEDLFGQILSLIDDGMILRAKEPT